jgi:DNA-binding transcriptional regulator LsrR (DeoR family)
MATQNPDDSKVEYLLQYLLAVELYRAGLTKGEIRKRLALSNNVVSAMLKGLSQSVVTRVDADES